MADQQSENGAFFPEVPEHGMSWRDGLDFLDRALDDCAQAGDDDPYAAIKVAAVREIVRAIRRYEDDIDESIRSALYEDALASGEAWAEESADRVLRPGRTSGGESS